MRTTKTLSVSLPPAQFKRAARLAKMENRTLSELVREALRQYEQKQDNPINHDLVAALRAVQQSAKLAGLDQLTEREIDAEVSAVRRKRGRRNEPSSDRS
jgi:predicted transcriptional regulator